MKQFFLGLLILVMPFFLPAQTLTGMSTVWNDSFVEWVIDTDMEGISGTFQQRFAAANNWNEWSFDFDEIDGTVRRPFRDDPSQWNIQADGHTVTARTQWANDLREWRITDNDITLTLRCKWNSSAEEWVIRESKYGKFAIYTTQEGDPRDWTIIDELDENISFAMKMALVSVAILNSVPKE